MEQSQFDLHLTLSTILKLNHILKYLIYLSFTLSGKLLLFYISFAMYISVIIIIVHHHHSFSNLNELVLINNHRTYNYMHIDTLSNYLYFLRCLCFCYYYVYINVYFYTLVMVAYVCTTSEYMKAYITILMKRTCLSYREHPRLTFVLTYEKCIYTNSQNLKALKDGIKLLNKNGFT